MVRAALVAMLVISVGGCTDRAAGISEPEGAKLLAAGEPCERDDECALPDELERSAVGSYCHEGGYCLQWVALPCYAGREVVCLDHGEGFECGTCGSE